MEEIGGNQGGKWEDIGGNGRKLWEMGRIDLVINVISTSFSSLNISEYITIDWSQSQFQPALKALCVSRTNYGYASLVSL